LRSKAARLVVQFITWAIIQYFVTHPQGYNLETWLLHVLQFPDNGLWFLWALFQCSCIMVLVNVAFQYTSRFLSAKRIGERHHSTVPLLTLISVGLIANALVRLLPGNPSFMSKAYFIYFFAGFIFHIVWPKGLPNTVRWIPYVIFAALAPFWYRTELSPLTLHFPKPELVNLEYQRIVAFAGTLAFVELVRLFVDKATGLLTQTVAFVGKRSLDIYAIHFYFLAYFPPVIAPIAISLGVSLLLRTNFVTSWLCLGQKPLNVWRIIRDRFPPITSRRSGITDKAVMISRE
jgi:hypothetical protein